MNRVKKMFFDLKSWRPLKSFKGISGSYSGLALSVYVKKKISLDFPFKVRRVIFIAGKTHRWSFREIFYVTNTFFTTEKKFSANLRDSSGPRHIFFAAVLSCLMFKIKTLPKVLKIFNVMPHIFHYTTVIQAQFPAVVLLHAIK
jgi:hypothetical protein